MKMFFPHLGDYEMNNHVVEYEPDRRIGWEPEAGRGHPGAAPDNPDSARWGQRWSYQLTPDGPGATIVTEIYDCSQAPEDERAGMTVRLRSSLTTPWSTWLTPGRPPRSSRR
jgi:hypothetical protein